MVGENIVLLPRHGDDPGRHILPHAINHQANMKALRDRGVKEIISLNSVGSLKEGLPPGAIVVPDDFILLSPYASVYVDRPEHITPGLDEILRQRCLAVAAGAGVEVIAGGVYWQTTGPRLETRAEIKLMSQFADIVGMTMASEAIIAQELGLRYASLCSVDNYGHGIGKKELRAAEIMAQGRRSRETLVRLLANYLAGETF